MYFYFIICAVNYFLAKILVDSENYRNFAAEK